MQSTAHSAKGQQRVALGRPCSAGTAQDWRIGRATRRLQALAAAFLAAALATVLSLASETAPAEGQRSFTLSTDPEEIVLRYNYGGGMGPSVVYTLDGDGSLVHERVQEAANHVSHRVEMQLGFLEQQELLRIVVDAGLLECDPECIEKRCAESYGLHRIAPAIDCGGVTLTLNLETYRGPAESTPTPAHRRMYQHCPHDVAELCPAIEDLQAIRDLGRALYEHKTAAQEAVE